MGLPRQDGGQGRTERCTASRRAHTRPRRQARWGSRTALRGCAARSRSHAEHCLHGKMRRGAASRVRAGHPPGLGAHTWKQSQQAGAAGPASAEVTWTQEAGPSACGTRPPAGRERSPRTEGPREPADPRLSSRPGPEPLPGTPDRSRRPRCRRASGPGAPTTPPLQGCVQGKEGAAPRRGSRHRRTGPAEIRKAEEGARGALAARWRQAGRAAASRPCRPRPGPRLSRPPLPPARTPTSGGGSRSRQ